MATPVCAHGTTIPINYEPLNLCLSASVVPYDNDTDFYYKILTNYKISTYIHVCYVAGHF